MISYSSMVRLTRPQIAIGSTIILGSLYTTRQFWWRSQAPILYPESDTTKQGNRFFLPVRDEEELSNLLLIKRPLLLNFTVRGDPYCNKVTGALQRVVTFDLDESKKKINVVDVEVDEPGTKELLLRFGVRDIPTVVCVRKTLPVDWFVDEKLKANPKNGEVDWEKLKAFVEKNADDD